MHTGALHHTTRSAVCQSTAALRMNAPRYTGEHHVGLPLMADIRTVAGVGAGQRTVAAAVGDLTVPGRPWGRRQRGGALPAEPAGERVQAHRERHAERRVYGESDKVPGQHYLLLSALSPQEKRVPLNPPCRAGCLWCLTLWLVRHGGSLPWQMHWVGCKQREEQIMSGGRLTYQAHSDTAWLPRALARIAISRPAPVSVALPVWVKIEHRLYLQQVCAHRTGVQRQWTRPACSRPCPTHARGAAVSLLPCTD